VISAADVRRYGNFAAVALLLDPKHSSCLSHEAVWLQLTQVWSTRTDELRDA